MKELAAYAAVMCILGYLFDKAKPTTKAAIIAGVAATGYGVYKLVEKANEPGDPYWGMDESPRDWV